MRTSCVALSLSLSVVALGAGSHAARAASLHAFRTAATAPAGKNGSAQRTLARPLGAHSIGLVGRPSVLQEMALCLRPTDPGKATCFAAINVNASSKGSAPGVVYGLEPNDLADLYAYPAPPAQGMLGSGQTVAVVVDGDYAMAEADLATYRQYFGLPPCTTANGCLSKVGAAATGNNWQTGSSTSVSAHPTTPSAIGWAAETDLDMQVVSAVCPKCSIMVAEAASDSMNDLTAAAGVAMAAGATVVNASFGAKEARGDLALSPVWENARVKVVAAAGDWGYGVYYPAADPGVIAVGGTSIAEVGNQVSETVWSGTGSGCSAYLAKSSWQQRQLGLFWPCLNRTVADVSAVADPLTGVAMYDSSLFGAAGGGWTVAGGTSVSAPLIAGMLALSGQSGRGTGAQLMYSAPSAAFLPVTSGSNGICLFIQLCTAGNGYSGPAGLGVPQGLAGI